MRFFVYLCLFLTLLFSCQENEKVVYIVFDNSEGISTGSDVMLNGVSVRKVLEIDLTDENDVLTTVKLSKHIDFPKGSAFEIQSKDVFTKIIHVTLNDSKSLIENGDTIQGVFQFRESQVSCGDGSPKILEEVKEMLKN